MKVFVTFTLPILFLFSPCSSDALTLAMPSWDFNIANLVKHADLVVLGKVTGMRLIPEAHSTSITLSVESVIKGDPAVGDRLLRFTVMGRTGMKKYRGKRILWNVEGSLEFRLGERLLLFMKKYHGDYQVFLHYYGKRIVTDNKVFIPYTYKISRFSDYHNEMREENMSRYVELPLDLFVKVAKASVKDYDAIMAIEAEVSKAVSLTREEWQHASSRTTLSIELLKRLQEIALQILGKRADGIGISRLESVDGERKPIADESVEIPDPNLRAAIEMELGRTSIAPITAADMESLTTLYAAGADISDLTGLEAAINLTELELHGNSISDLSPLWELTNLTELELHDDNISDIRALWRLTNLVHLELWDNTISDLYPLISNTGLRRGDRVSMDGNPLSVESINTHIPILLRRGVDVRSDTPVNIPDPNQGTLATRWRVIKRAPVNIPDPNLRAKIEAMIELELGKPVGTSITLDDMAMLTMLAASSANINDLTGLEAATSLTWLYLFDNNISDLSPLSGLTNLTKLDLQSNRTSDISALSRLTKLTTLYLNDNNISDLSPLSGLTNLIHLGLGVNRISDLSPLSGLTNLILLGLSVNHISDLSPLSGLTNLTELALDTNAISDISVLAELTNLTGLGLDANSISDLSPLSKLTNLTGLELRTNGISDISPLAGLTSLAFLWLDTNTISDISVLAGLTNLEALGLEDNNISDISPLVANTGLGREEEVYVRDSPWDRVKPHPDSEIGEEVYVRDNPLNA